MSKKQKKMLTRIIVAAAVYVLAIILPVAEEIKAALYIAGYIIAGWDIVWKACRNILHGQVFDENFLMSVATIGAFALGEYKESIAVMLFYQVGELFQSYAVGKSRQSISDLMDICPEYANVERDGELLQVEPEEVAVGDLIIVKPGERIPLDGVITKGQSFIDTSALTGEAVPRQAGEGQEVISGCINQNGRLVIRVTKEFSDSTVARILELVENASSKKSRSEKFITKFARYYTPAVVIAAVALSVLPPLILGQSFIPWITRALTFLVISCPCALVISIPLSFFGGIGGASRHGILIKGGNYLEALANVGVVVFDKTGTLTQGKFNVTANHPEEDGLRSLDERQEELLYMATLAESYSDHPISHSLREAWKREVDKKLIRDVEEIAGHGVIAQIDGREVAAGNLKLMKRVGADSAHECHLAGTAVHIAVDGVYKGHIIISDIPKLDARVAIQKLKNNGVHKTVMLTGDVKNVAESVSKELGLDAYYAELLPGDKVDCLENMLNEKTGRETLAFVGDGINDAPVLTRADIGIAMGGMGSDAAIEAADIVLMDDQPSKIAAAIGISKKTMRIVKQNIVFALGVKAIILILGALGIANMWAAVFADVGVAVIAILNAMRAMYYKAE